MGEVRQVGAPQHSRKAVFFLIHTGSRHQGYPEAEGFYRTSFKTMAPGGGVPGQLGGEYALVLSVWLLQPHLGSSLRGQEGEHTLSHNPTRGLDHFLKRQVTDSMFTSCFFSVIFPASRGL